MLLSLPFWQQPHAGGTEDVERRLLVFALRDVSGGEAEEGVEVVTGPRRSLRQSVSVLTPIHWLHQYQYQSY